MAGGERDPTEHSPRWAWEHALRRLNPDPDSGEPKVISYTTLCVALVLGTYVDSVTEDAYPTNERLAQICGLSERSVRTQLGKLQALGAITRKTKGTGPGHAILWRIEPPPWTPTTIPTPEPERSNTGTSTQSHIGTSKRSNETSTGNTGTSIDNTGTSEQKTSVDVPPIRPVSGQGRKTLDCTKAIDVATEAMWASTTRAQGAQVWSDAYESLSPDERRELNNLLDILYSPVSS